MLCMEVCTFWLPSCNSPLLHSPPSGKHKFDLFFCKFCFWCVVDIQSPKFSFRISSFPSSPPNSLYVFAVNSCTYVQPQVVSNLLCILKICFFWRFHVVGVIQYVISCLAFFTYLNFFFKLFFWCGPFLKSLLNLLQYYFCCLCSGFLAVVRHMEFSSLIRDRAHTPALEDEVLTTGLPGMSLA